MATTSPLSLEPLLVERIKNALDSHTPAVHVLTAADLDGVTEERQLVPAVQVVFAGFKPVSADVGNTRIECTWYTVLVVKNVSAAGAAGKGAAARTSANAMAHAVYTALVGWTPDGHSKPLSLAPGPRAEHSKGFFYLPLMWRTEFVWRSEITTPSTPFFP